VESFTEERFGDWSAALRQALTLTGKWQPFTYSGPPGSRAYYVYQPVSCTVAVSVPLVVVLHGCTQSAEDAATGTRWNELADQQSFVVVYPQQSRDDNPRCCFNWFLREHQDRGSGEAGIIAGITRQVIDEDTRWGIDPSRVYVVGMSAGAAMAVNLAASYPDRYAALGVHSGIEYQAASNAAEAFQVMKLGGPNPEKHAQAVVDAMGSHARLMPSITVHGTADRVVNPINGEQVVRQWIAANRHVAQATYPAKFDTPTSDEEKTAPGGMSYRVRTWNDVNGNVVQKYWVVIGMDHAWSGGSVLGSFTDPRGPNATEAMYEFFDRHSLAQDPPTP
jgi:poly(hydroxyalkanoate) depolymerase family esterase